MSLEVRARPLSTAARAGCSRTRASEAGSIVSLSSTSAAMIPSASTRGRASCCLVRRPVAYRKRSTLQVCLPCERDVFQEMGQLGEEQRLWAVDQGLGGIGVKVDQHHVGAGNDALRRDMKQVEDAFVF